MKFHVDGSLIVPPKKARDHLVVFHVLSEVSFPIGKQLLIKILRGETTRQIKQHGFDSLVHHGSLGGYEPDELSFFIDVLVKKKFLEVKLEKGTYSVLVLSPLAFEELASPSHSFKVDDVSLAPFVTTRLPDAYVVAPLTSLDKELFAQFDFFLHSFTDEQKKAIICKDVRQACIAGAGSGKTSVLTHKIVFLVKYASVSPEKILAITFTRKARQEMMDRLATLLPNVPVRVETFHSFAEKALQKHAKLLYGHEKMMASPKEFLAVVVEQLKVLGFSVDTFLQHYFSARERGNKEQRQLFFSFLYDFRTLLEAFILHQKDVSFFEHRLKSAKLSERITAQHLMRLVVLVSEALDEKRLRTYADQLVECNQLFDTHSSIIPSFDWVLVDEYQDVNVQQISLLEKLSPPHLFVVGDPRQSIYAWRGANPQTMFEFISALPTTIVELTTNFRSTKNILLFANALIAQANNGKNVFSPLHAQSDQAGTICVERFATDEIEASSVVASIQALQIPRNEIFVLSRTNKGLELIARACQEVGISFVMRTEEGVEQLRSDAIVLATVHAIKGLEAQVVFAVGVSSANYPCKAKDHHFVELLAGKESYDVFEEERRILYVALTRAKEVLRISYVGVPSMFLGKKVLSSCEVFASSLSGLHIPSERSTAKQRSALRRWRFLESKERHVAAYQIFSDKVLEQLLSLQPLTLEELHQVAGLSKSKIDEFGLDMLQVLHSS